MQTVVSADQLPPSPTPESRNAPLFVIEARKSGVNFNLRDWWVYRELLYFLIWRDIKVRYRQTLIGAAWAIIQPLVTMVVFTVFFGRLAKMPSDGLPYPLFAFAALVPWTFFARGLTQSSESLVANQHLITKVYIPRLLLPLARVLGGLPDLGFSFVVLLGMIWWYQPLPSLSGLLWVLALVLLAM